MSACRRLQSIINFVETSGQYSRVQKAVLLPQAPIRQYADPLTRRRSRSGGLTVAILPATRERSDERHLPFAERL